MNIKKLFFELIQVALDVRVYLSHSPTDNEWKMLYDMAKKQSLVGVCFAGVQKLVDQQQTPEEMLYLTWMGMAAKIQQRNEVMDRRTQQTIDYFANKKVGCQILKGQSINRLYGSLKGLRQSGDIDVWVSWDRNKLYEMSTSEFGNITGKNYFHIHYPLFSDTEVEAHFHPSYFTNPILNRKFKSLCNRYRPTTDGLRYPDPVFNGVYILLHCYRHFCGHGVGFRQVMDYYFLLKSYGRDVQLKKEIFQNVKSLGMERFAQATMWVLKETFGLEKDFLLCVPNEDEGRFLLNEILCAGNMGHGEERFIRNYKNSLTRFLSNQRKNFHLLAHYPNEVLWSPWFNIYRYILVKFIY